MLVTSKLGINVRLFCYLDKAIDIITFKNYNLYRTHSELIVMYHDSLKNLLQHGNFIRASI